MGRPRTSLIYRYYDSSEVKSVCKSCQQELSKTTTCLKKHLRAKHELLWIEFMSLDTQHQENLERENRAAGKPTQSKKIAGATDDEEKRKTKTIKRKHSTDNEDDDDIDEFEDGDHNFQFVELAENIKQEAEDNFSESSSQDFNDIEKSSFVKRPLQVASVSSPPTVLQTGGVIFISCSNGTEVRIENDAVSINNGTSQIYVRGSKIQIQPSKRQIKKKAYR